MFRRMRRFHERLVSPAFSGPAFSVDVLQAGTRATTTGRQPFDVCKTHVMNLHYAAAAAAGAVIARRTRSAAVAW